MSNLGFQWVYRLLNREEDVACERFFVGGGGRRPPRAADARERHAARRLPARRLLHLVGDGLRELPAAPLGRADPARADGARRGGPDRPRRRRLRADQPRPAHAVGRRLRHGRRREARPRASARSCAATSRATGRSRRSPRSPASTSRRVHGLRAEAADEGKIVVQQFKAAEGATREPPHTTLLTPHTELSDKLLIEVARGCSEMCRFCWAAYAMAPQVRIPAERLLDVARRNRPLTSRVGLIATAVADHPEILPILRGLQALDFHIALSSVKIDAISEEILAILTAQGERALAIAPEAGNERLRRALNKKVSDEMLREKVRIIAESGITQLKLYLQIGLPGETDEDVADLVRLVDDLRMIVLAEGTEARPRRDARPDGERLHPEAAHPVRERSPRRPGRDRAEDEAPRRRLQGDAERDVPRHAARRGGLGGLPREDGARVGADPRGGGGRRPGPAAREGAPRDDPRRRPPRAPGAPGPPADLPRGVFDPHARQSSPWGFVSKS